MSDSWKEKNIWKRKQKNATKSTREIFFVIESIIKKKKKKNY